MNEKFRIFIRISLKLIHNGPIDNESALVQIMTWRRKGDKPLPEPLMTQYTYVYVWVALWLCVCVGGGGVN